MTKASKYWKLLSASGVSLEELGLNDMALSRASEILKRSSVPVLGGDVYFKQTGRVEVAYAN